MSHFFTIALVPSAFDRQQIDLELNRLLAPFDENTRVDPYPVAIEQDELEKMSEYYKTTDINELREHTEAWRGGEGKIKDGKLFYITTYNPKSQWDWWMIGGRYEGRIHHPFGTEVHPESDNFATVKEMLETGIVPFALITPDGEWHDKGKMGWWGIVTDEKDQEAWPVEVKRLLEAYPNCIGVGLDLHI